MTADVLAFADRFMAALERANAAEVVGFYTPDASIWHNFDDVAQSVTDNLKTLAWMARKFPSRRYRVVRRELLSDGWLQQHVLELDSPETGPLRLHACCVIKIRDGLIERIEEYLDPAQVAVGKSARR